MAGFVLLPRLHGISADATMSSSNGDAKIVASDGLAER
jgi:hypothetical protein